MTTLAEATLATKLLEIRTLHVASGDGRANDRHSVLCPRRRESVSLEGCMNCEAGGGVVPDPAGHRRYVSCRFEGPVVVAVSPVPGVAPPTLADRTPVSAVMTTRVMAVRSDVSLEALADLFLAREIGGVPVVDAEGRPIGVISKTDLLEDAHEAGDTQETLPPRPRSARGYRVDLAAGYHAERPARTVADAMTRTTFAVSESAPVSQAAALMAFEGIHRLPVLSADGRVAGMITALDVLRWLAQQDGYLLPSGRSLAS